MIETIINTPKVLTDNDAAITYDGISELSRCTLCCNGGWLSYQNGSPIFKILGNNYTGRYEINFSGTVSSATAGVVAVGLYEDRCFTSRHGKSSYACGSRRCSVCFI